jgi:pyrroloquinoline-quinone synthase
MSIQVQLRPSDPEASLSRAEDALRFKMDVLWAQLDALYHAYVAPGMSPPRAFVPDDRR